VFLNAVEEHTVSFQCRACGAPLEFLLTEPKTRCPSCGSAQEIEGTAIERVLSSFHRIDSLQRQELATNAVDQQRVALRIDRLSNWLAGAAVLVGTGALLLFPLFIYIGGRSGLYIVCSVGGLALLAMLLRFRRSRPLEIRPDARTIGHVRCMRCGAQVPFATSSDLLRCSFCRNRLVLDQDALEAAIATAETRLVDAETQVGNATILDAERLAAGDAFAESSAALESEAGARVRTVAIEPNVPTCVRRRTVRLAAMATLEDGTSLDVTSEATWVSDNLDILVVGTEGFDAALLARDVVVPEHLAPGRVFGISRGSATVTVLIGSAQASATVFVE
jgi:DNA-directed RNA polymerase subunit RPC12/RpoP